MSFTSVDGVDLHCWYRWPLPDTRYTRLFDWLDEARSAQPTTGRRQTSAGEDVVRVRAAGPFG